MGIYSTISFLADEGSEVKKDDIVAEFDTKDIKSRNRWSLRSVERDEINLKRLLKKISTNLKKKRKDMNLLL